VVIVVGQKLTVVVVGGEKELIGREERMLEQKS
jgi:hypothetical protein